MRKCQECGSDEWEFITYIGEYKELYQCKKCKRVVCSVENTMYDYERVI